MTRRGAMAGGRHACTNTRPPACVRVLAIVIALFVLPACREVEPEQAPVSRAEELRQRGAELVRGAPAPAPDPVTLSDAPLTDVERGDVRALCAVLVGPDPVDAALTRVDDAVERDLPVLAAQRLRAAGLGAAQAQVAQLEAIEVSSDLGSALHRQGVAALRQRHAALEAYAAALERGIVEDLVLADALRDQRRAADALVQARAACTAAQRRIDASAEGE